MKRIISLILSVTILLTITAGLNFSVYATEPTSGQCGENVYWSYDSETDTVTFSGSGKMADFYYFHSDEWGGYDYYDDPEWCGADKFVFEEGITYIGSGIFHCGNHISSITLPVSLESIGENLFYYYNNDISIYYNGTIDDWCKISNKDYYDSILNNNRLCIDNSLIENVEISSETINNNAFYGYKYLKSVKILDGVKKIGSRAFSYCTNLSEITLPDALTNISESAFSNCSNLLEITLPDTLTNISESAFSNCSNLSEITLPDALTNIGEHAFSNCSNLSEITLPDALTNIGESAFSNCSNLSEITLPDALTNIGESAFRNCSNLSEITLPDTLTNIKASAFYNTAYYNNKDNWDNHALYISNVLLDIENSETSYDLTIKDGTYYVSCSDNNYINNHIKSLTIPNSVKYLFADYDDYDYYDEGGYEYAFSIPEIYYDGTLSEWLNLKNSNLISSKLYLKNKLLTEATVQGVSKIKPNAFRGLIDLKTITIDNDVEEIGYDAFCRCKSLETVRLGNGLQSIKDYAFSSCTSLNSITIPNNVSSIPCCAFYNCSALTSVTLPKSISNIYSSAFEECTSLTKTNYTGTINSWANIRFSGTSSNPIYYSKNLYINDQLVKNISIDTSISDFAFVGCNSLKKVNVSNNCKRIGQSAFSECESLESINIPDSVTEIGCRDYEGYTSGNTFYGCKSLTDITIGNGVKSIYASTFYNCSKLERVIINAGTEYISRKAFWNCPSLKSITIKNPNCDIFNDYDTISGTAAIIGYVGSTAHVYAANYNRTFVDIENPGSSAHNHNYTTKTTAATPSKNGSIVISCDICGDELFKQIVYRPANYKLSASAYIYNGKAKKPTVTVTDANGGRISADNYSLTYSNNKNVGKATVKITFKGNYSGSVSKTFTIKPKKTDITSVKAKSKGFTVKWAKVAAQADGYQVQWSTNSSFKSANKSTVKGCKNTKKSVSKLKSNEKYFVRVRTYKKVGNTTYYSSWCKSKSVKTLK